MCDYDYLQNLEAELILSNGIRISYHLSYKQLFKMINQRKIIQELDWR
jgi:hypothetical protein